tara:strand:+ start:7564 stop:13437 length:5874 start_codon:yes stop_codon:yes gene_type:complete
MKCPNKNTVQYKALLKVFKTDLITTNVIQSWQSATGSEAIPTVTEANKYASDKKVLHNLKQREFGLALLNNLRRERIIHSHQGAYYINNTEQDVETIRPSDELIESNIKRLERYLQVNNLPATSIKLDKTPKTFAVTVDSSLFSAKDMLEKSRSWDLPRTRKVVQHLMRMFPDVNIALLSVNEATKLYESVPQWKKGKVPFAKINSFYVDGQAILIKGRVTDEIAIEEMLHPFIDAIKVDNIPLFESLLKESKRNFPVMSQQIEDTYNNKRRINAEEREMEVVTQALARHFKKEYESNPTQSFKDVIGKLLDWFKNIIENFNQYLTGRKIPSSAINPNASMSDIAKLLNTNGIAFEVGRRPNGKVSYSLSESKQEIVNSALAEAVSEQQQIVINNLFHNVKEAKNESDTLSANNPESFINNLVVLNKSNNTFYDLNTNLQYNSVSNAIGNNVETGLFDNKGNVVPVTLSEVRDILDVIVAKKTYEGDNTNLFEQLRNDVSTIVEQGDVVLSNVVFSDPKSKLASIADLVIIDKFGKLRIGKVNIQSDPQLARTNKLIQLPESSLLINNNITSLSQDVLDMLEVNLLRRMAENMGYDIQMNSFDTFSINILNKDGVLESENITPRPPSQNLYMVDYLIQKNPYDLSGEQLDKEFEAADTTGQIYDARTDNEFTEEFSKLDPYANQPLSYMLGAIKEYKKDVISAKEMLNKAKNNVMLDRKGSATQTLDNTLSIINFAIIDPENNKTISVGYTQLLQDTLRQMKEYEDYITNPDNITKREFVNYLLNFDKFLSTFEGLYELESKGFEELNATQRYLINNIKGTVTRLLGPTSQRETGRQGLINRALFDFAGEVVLANISQGFDEGGKTVIQDHSGMTFTAADIQDLLAVVPDITLGERFTKDIASSRDVILQTLDKVYKRGWLQFLNARDARRQRIIAPLEKLRKLQPGVKSNRLYDYMLNYEEDGTLSENAYVRPIGPQYFEQKQELSLKMRDVNGVPLVYAPVYDIIEAKKTKEGRADIEYNKKLANLKKDYGDFMTAEVKDDNNMPVDGEYHRYNQEFKTARSKFETWNSNGYGQWVKKRGVSQSDYDNFRAKYYEETRYTKAFRVKGVPTGQVKADAKFNFVKKDYVEVRLETGSGRDMRNVKYKEIMEPKVNDALAVARREVYDMFIEEFAEGKNSLLSLLPRDVRNQMLGKIPLVVDNLASNLRSDPAGGLFVRLWAKTQRSLKNLVTSTTEQKTVIIDSQGRMVDTLPIMYTGSPRVEKRLGELENQITDLKQQFKNGKLGRRQYDTERAVLEAKVAKQRSQPTLGEVSTDLGASLLMFNDMAEKFEALGQVEGTINALVKVIEKREYLTPGTSTIEGVFDKIIPEQFNLKGRLGIDGEQANAVARARKWAKMVFYDNDEITKSKMDKFSNALIALSSQSYVAWNIFGNINNLAIAQVNNAIEGVASRFTTRDAFAKGKLYYNMDALPGIVKRTGAIAQDAGDILLGSEDIGEGAVKGAVLGGIVGTAVAGPLGTAVGSAIGSATVAGLSGKELKERSYKPDQANSKYEATAEFWRMMDADVDIRESGMDNTQGQQNRFQRGMSIGYLFQDGFEYAVQTQIGTSLLIDIQVIDSKTGESANLYDAAIYNDITGKISYSDKWDTIIPNYKTGIKVPLETNIKDSKIYAEIRNNIREVNKTIHGNYARVDRTVLQSHWFGKLMFQFKKWLPPALRARYQHEYFDGNLGWMEGRYNSTWKLATYFAKNLVKGRSDMRNILKEYKEGILADNKSNPGAIGGAGTEIGRVSLQLRLDNKMKNVNRTMAEMSFIIASFLAFQLLDNLWDDDAEDELWVRKLKNWGKYQTDRVYTELILFLPVIGAKEMGGFLERPIASTRTLGAISEAMLLSVRTPYNWLSRKDDNEFYQNKDIVYQNRPRKGQLKVYKQWRDALPILYTLQKWTTFEKMDNFYLGNN